MQHSLQLYTSILSNTFLSLEKSGSFFPHEKNTVCCFFLMVLITTCIKSFTVGKDVIEPFKSYLTHSDNMHWISEIKSCLE